MFGAIRNALAISVSVFLPSVLPEICTVLKQTRTIAKSASKPDKVILEKLKAAFFYFQGGLFKIKLLIELSPTVSVLNCCVSLSTKTQES